MIVLKPTDNRDTVKEYYNKENIPFNDTSNCLLATEGEDIIGYCLFDIDKVLMVHIISPTSDLPLLDGILRSTLHVGCERGIVDAFYSDTAPETAFKVLNFIKNIEEKSLNVDKLFQSCCCSK